MAISIRDRQRYNDIEWLMPSVDVVDVLERLGCESITVHGDQVQCLCPDHEMFVNRISSHPNWICNVNTGETYCRTEPRGSNLVWTVRRVLESRHGDCSVRKAVEFITGGDVSNLMTASILGKIKKMERKTHDIAPVEPIYLDSIQKDLDNRYISEACYQFFLHPPGKKPTNINRDTVDHFKVFERRWGYYSNRAVVPFFMKGELVGFCAIDLLGKEQWLLEHPVNDEDDYRKTLYPKNFRAKECLFGFDECKKGCDYLVVTEGAREVMKIWQELTPNAVGVLKATVSDEQVMLIAELAPKEIVLMFDGDPAGWSATEKNAEKLRRNFKVRPCYLPEDMDPKNFDAQGLKKLIKYSKTS